MKVEGSSVLITKSANSTNNTAISVNSLPENGVYTVCVVVSNAEGNVSTNKRVICESVNFYAIVAHLLQYSVDTTDVQNVTAVPTESANDVNTLLVQCYFVNGSTAKGCMVVLVGELGNVNNIMNLTRDNPYRTVNTSLPLSCYTGVFGYDIESDGSVGTLAVPGVISNKGSCICEPHPPLHVCKY